MGVLGESFENPRVFETIPTLHEAIDIFESKLAKELLNNFGDIFVKHNQQANFGLAMIHRHFSLEQNEILVESVKEDKSVSVAVPWHIIGKEVFPSDEQYWSSFGLQHKPFIVPQSWAFSSNGKLQPFEYLSTDEECISPPATFVDDLFLRLKEYKLENVFGLRRLDMSLGSTWETTPKGIRANITTIGEIPDSLDKNDIVKVTWYFDDNGKANEGGGCVLCFCSHCASCSHCNAH